MESKVRPIWIPTSVLETWFFSEEGFSDQVKSARTKSSKTK
jgi:hypothetical protein